VFSPRPATSSDQETDVTLKEKLKGVVRVMEKPKTEEQY
jgi:hypothetical protein